MSWHEEKEEARADFINENQEFSEDDIDELKGEIKELKEVARVFISVFRHQRVSDRTMERVIDYMKRHYGFTEEDFEPRFSWMNFKE